MRQRSRGFPIRLLALALITMLLLAACGGNDDPTPTTEPEPAASVPEASSDQAADPATDQPTDDADSSSTEQETPDDDSPAIAGQPDAPAPVDSDFRSDPATLVAATGNPQLLEFFTNW